jgi:putative hydrolase of the HAD superfamily
MRRGSSTEIFNEYLTNQGINIPYEVFIEAYIPIARTQERKALNEGHKEPDYRKRIEDVFTQLEINEPILHSYGAWEYYLKKWPMQTEFFHGVPEMLCELKKDYKLGVITNFMDGATCREIFTKLGYYEIFNTLIVSHELGYMKPAEILFNTALEGTGSKSESSIMVGDTYSADIIGGNQAGMKTVLVDIYNNQQVFYSDCSMIIKNINEFPDALKLLNSS